MGLQKGLIRVHLPIRAEHALKGQYIPLWTILFPLFHAAPLFAILPGLDSGERGVWNRGVPPGGGAVDPLAEWEDDWILVSSSQLTLT